MCEIGSSFFTQLIEFFSSQAVVVSIDPRRVYVNHPDDVPYKVIRVTDPGMPMLLSLFYLRFSGVKEYYELAIYYALNVKI